MPNRYNMGLFDLFHIKKEKPIQPEDHYRVAIADECVEVTYPGGQKDKLNWNDIQEIQMINTDEGPFLPDVFLILISEKEKCMIPQGAKGFDEVYEIVSKYENFNFENFIKSMQCTDNAVFVLWEK